MPKALTRVLGCLLLTAATLCVPGCGAQPEADGPTEAVGQAVPASIFGAEPLPAGSRIAFLGDSITYYGDFDGAFPDYDVDTFGVIGDTSEGVLARLEPVIAFDPSAVFLMVGTNDLAYNVSVEDIVANVRSILQGLRSSLPDATLVIESVIPTASAGKNQRIVQLDADLAELVDPDGIADAYLDLYSVYEVNGLLPEDYSDDGLHITSESYAPWYDLVRVHWLTGESGGTGN